MTTIAAFHGGHPFLSAFFFLLFLIVIALLIAWAVSYFVAHREKFGSQKGGRRDEALETLRMRYARGEVSSEDFQRMSADLSRENLSVIPAPPPT
jgi:uncharacterized membrane protein